MPLTGIYKIAEKTIEIISIHEDVHRLCRDYKDSGVPDFSVKISPDDISWERIKSAAEDEKENIPVRQFGDAYLETLAVYRKIAEQMIEYDTILFHGSVVAVDGAGYLFTAKSGTGKSTHTRLWRELFGERAVMVNDDKPLLKIAEDGVNVFGTPWDGKLRLSSNISVPLKAICILERSVENQIRKIEKKNAFPMLVQQTYRSQDPMKLIKTMELIDKAADICGLYILGCNQDIEAAQVAYDGMKG